MEGRNLGKLVVAGLLAGCVVLACMLAFEDRETGAGPPRPDRGPNRSRSQAVAETAPVLRHAAAPAAGASGPAGFVTVRVVSAEDRTVIAGATVVVPGLEHDERAHRVTDAEGVARFGPLAPHEFQFEAAAAGRLPRRATTVVQESAESSVDLALEAAVTVSVRVEDGAGDAVSDAHATVSALGGGYSADARTDATGHASFATPGDAILRVSVQANRWSDAVQTVRSPAASGKSLALTFRLTAPVRLAGTVSDAYGRPMSRAAVILRPAHEPMAPWSETEGRFRTSPGEMRGFTDASGRYWIGPLTAGRAYRAFALLLDGSLRSASAIADVFVPAGTQEFARDFVVAPPGVLVVRVTNADGTPADDAQFLGTNTQPRPAPGTETFDALFVLSDAEIDVVAAAPDGRCATRRTLVPPGETRKMTIALPQTVQGVASGIVVDDAGRPVDGARVRAWAVPFHFGERLAFSAVSAADGSFALRTAYAGSAMAAAEHEAHLDGEPVPISFPSEGTRLVVRRPSVATVTFRIAPPAGAESAPAAQVRLGADSTERRPDGDGVYRLLFAPSTCDRVEIVFGPANFGRLPAKPTAADLEAAYAKFAPIVRALRAAPGEVVDLGTLTPERPSMLRLRVTDAGGRPVVGATVKTTWRESWMPYSLAPPSTDADGCVAFHYAPSAGAAPVVVSADGFITRSADVTPGGDARATLTLYRGGLLWGTVTDRAGAAVPDAEVLLTDASGAQTSVRAGADGVFGVRVAAGRWLVAADHGPPESAQAVESGDTEVRVVAGVR